jgi:hypothetical protein
MMHPLHASGAIQPKSPQMAMFIHSYYNYASPNEMTTQAGRV